MSLLDAVSFSTGQVIPTQKVHPSMAGTKLEPYRLLGGDLKQDRLFPYSLGPPQSYSRCSQCPSHIPCTSADSHSTSHGPSSHHCYQAVVAGVDVCSCHRHAVKRHGPLCPTTVMTGESGRGTNATESHS